MIIIMAFVAAIYEILIMCQVQSQAFYLHRLISTLEKDHSEAGVIINPIVQMRKLGL